MGTATLPNDDVDKKYKKSHIRKKIAYPVTQIDDCVKYSFRQHNQEVHHLTIVGAEGQRKITVEKGTNTDKWKTVRGFVGGQQQDKRKERIWSCDQKEWAGTSGSQSVKLRYP